MLLLYLFCLGAFVLPNDRFGTVTVARLLNNEKVSQYNLTLIAKDGGDFTGGTSLNSTVCARNTM